MSRPFPPALQKWFLALKPADLPAGLVIGHAKVEDPALWLNTLRREVKDPKAPRHKYRAPAYEIRELYRVLNGKDFVEPTDG